MQLFGRTIYNMNSLYQPIQPNQIADWHPADIVAALRKGGKRSLRQLGVDHGYAPTTLRNAFVRPAPAYEKIIAAEIGVHPAVIWPTRYDAEGKSKHLQRGRPKGSKTKVQKLTIPAVSTNA